MPNRDSMISCGISSFFRPWGLSPLRGKRIFFRKSESVLRHLCSLPSPAPLGAADSVSRRISDTDRPIPMYETDVESPGDDGETEKTPGRLAYPAERKATWRPRRRKHQRGRGR